MRTDKLAYLWLQEIPEGFFTLIGRDKTDAQRYTFKSVELKETAFRIDAVFTPQEADDITYFILISLRYNFNLMKPSMPDFLQKFCFI